MGESTPSTVPSYENPLKVRVLVKPLFRTLTAGVSDGPLESFPGVVIGDGEEVLRCSTVVYGQSDDVCLGGEGADVVVVDGREGGHEAKCSAVDVKEEREFSGGRVGDFWEEEAAGETGFGRDDDIF